VALALRLFEPDSGSHPVLHTLFDEGLHLILIQFVRDSVRNAFDPDIGDSVAGAVPARATIDASSMLLYFIALSPGRPRGSAATRRQVACVSQ
jgi:hypothetical protein